MASVYLRTVQPPPTQPASMPKVDPSDPFLKCFPDDWTGFTKAQQQEFRIRVEARSDVSMPEWVPEGAPLLWLVAPRARQQMENYNHLEDHVWRLSHCPPRGWREILDRMLAGEREAAQRRLNGRRVPRRPHTARRNDDRPSVPSAGTQERTTIQNGTKTRESPSTTENATTKETTSTQDGNV